MPCSHLPRHGGPYSPAWSRPVSAVPAPNGSAADDANVFGAMDDVSERNALEDEIARLREELTRARQQTRHAGSASPHMVCLALLVFAAAALFACYTIITHG